MNRFYLLLFWPLLLSIALAVFVVFQAGFSESYIVAIALILVGSIIPLTWALIFPQRSYKHQHRWFIVGGIALATALRFIPLNDLFLDLRLPIQELLIAGSFGAALYFFNQRTTFYPTYSSEKIQRNIKMKINGFSVYLIASIVGVILTFIFKSEDNGLVKLLSTIENIALIAAGYGYYREAIHWHKHGESSELVARIEEIGKTNE